MPLNIWGQQLTTVKSDNNNFFLDGFIHGICLLKTSTKTSWPVWNFPSCNMKVIGKTALLSWIFYLYSFLYFIKKFYISYYFFNIGNSFILKMFILNIFDLLKDIRHTLNHAIVCGCLYWKLHVLKFVFVSDF